MDKKPSRIYKYAAFDISKIILTHQTLKFSAPSDFNDPFDCDIDLVDFDFNQPIAPQVAHEIELLKIQFKGSKWFNEKASDRNFWKEVYKGGQIEKIKSSRICCFSLENDITLMWSHYADKHNGICLEFDNSLEQRFVNLTSKDVSEGHVAYEAHERINYVAEDRHYGIYKLFLNKSESWSHEKEYRMITINNKPDIQKFYPRFLSAIYFGVKVTESQIHSFITEFGSAEFGHLKFYKGVKDKLKIKFIPL
jgi:hypothetical protein